MYFDIGEVSSDLYCKNDKQVKKIVQVAMRSDRRLHYGIQLRNLHTLYLSKPLSSSGVRYMPFDLFNSAVSSLRKEEVLSFREDKSFDSGGILAQWVVTAINYALWRVGHWDFVVTRVAWEPCS